MYVLRLFTTLFRPSVAARRIACQHPNEKHALIDLGRNKMWRCDDCGAAWFASGSAA